MMTDRPQISIIIPTHDRPGQLASCLGALTRLDYYHGGFKVVIVDDGGKARLAPIIDAYHGILRITLCSQPQSGPAAARNTGASTGQGQVSGFHRRRLSTFSGLAEGLERPLG